MNEMEAIIKEFIVETNENLDRFDRDLIELEKHPSAQDRLASIFRAIHSIKGATGFLKLLKLGAVAHAGEGLLSRLRDGTLVMTPEITNVLLALVDGIRQMLSCIEQTGTEGDVDYGELVRELTSLRENERLADSPSAAAASAGSLLSTGTETFQASPGQGELSRVTVSAGNIRVAVKQLDVLMNLVGELVLTRNELMQHSLLQQDSILLDTSQRLNLITTELQEGIMKIRMQPIDNVWAKFPRVVRDLAFQAGKTVHLEMHGKETELDKTLIEAITDPLLHLVRNAIDHGLETPDARLAAGKSAEGHLLLKAFHEGGQVDIEISDDGRGIDSTRVKLIAIERAFITPDQGRLMDDQEALSLIFLPGFSTAEKVTIISGRGVGMDVVKTNVEKIGGKVSIQSQLGVGTTLKIKIPLTLAIMPALIVRAGGERYAIPQSSVLELVRLEADDKRKGLEKIQNAPVYRLRGDLLPLVWLGTELKIAGQDSNETAMNNDEAANIVVLLANDRKFGLVVEEVNDTHEIVVKPLGEQLRGLPMFAGATIMGDGRVVLILDVAGLAFHAKVLAELRDPNETTKEILSSPPVEDKQTLLLFAGSDDARMAVKLTQVSRLEKFPWSAVERTGNQAVVQYMQKILPLVNISTLLPERRFKKRIKPQIGANETIQAIVYSKEGWSVGLVVENIIDTVEQSLINLYPASRKGALASMVIDGRITELLDLDVLCANCAAALPRTAVFAEANL